MNYLLILIVAVLIAFFMYVSHIRATNKDLRRQKQNLQTKIIQEQAHTNIKEFQAYQKAKKEEIEKDIKKGKDERDINLSIGSHSVDF